VDRLQRRVTEVSGYLDRMDGLTVLAHRLADPGSKGINSLAFNASSGYLATADRNGRAYIWSMTARKIVAVLPDPGSTTNVLCASPQKERTPVHLMTICPVVAHVICLNACQHALLTATLST
jgi:hypothetical protein